MTRGMWLVAAIVVAMTVAVAGTVPRVFLWRDPGVVESFDFANSPDIDGKPPSPPFRFERIDPSGTQPKLFVRDASGTTWNVKFGFEVKAESFAWRVIRACGYFAEPSYYVASGRFENMPLNLTPRPATVSADGRFTDARFQLRSPAMQFVSGGAWHWTENSFRDSVELKGLRVLLMLLSNFDNKDSRVGIAGGPNTGTFRVRGPRGEELWYAFTDWGSTMGRWGHLSGQSDWDCAGYAAQTPGFVKGVRAGRVEFGFEGHVPEFNDGITPADLRWLLARLGRITDAQLRTGLAASGATVAEIDCFGRALRRRIQALEMASREGGSL